MPVEVAAAGHRALAADVERRERVHLPGIRGCRRSCRTAAARPGSEAVASMRPNSSGGPWYWSRSGRMVGGLDGLGREASAPSRAPCRRPRHGRAVRGDQHAGDAVVGAHALDVVPDDRHAGRLPRPDRLVQLVDRRFFEAKRLAPRSAFVGHERSALIPEVMCALPRPRRGRVT